MTLHTPEMRAPTMPAVARASQPAELLPTIPRTPTNSIGSEQRSRLG